MRSSNHLACTENRRCSVPFCAGTARPRTGEDAGEGGRRLGSGGRTAHSDEPGGGGRKKKKKGREGNSGSGQEEAEAGAREGDGVSRARGKEEIRGTQNYRFALPLSLSFMRQSELNTASLIRKPIPKPKSII